MLDIDLNLLTHLAVLLQTRSVTQSARRLGISQPAMSRSLAELRRLIGDPLLVRTRGGMLPTGRAEELMKPLQNWLAQVPEIILPPALDPASLSRRFRIVAADYAIRSVVAPALPAILDAAPAAALDFQPDGADAETRLGSGEADLVLTHIEPHRHLVHERLLTTEPYVCVAQADHPLAVRSFGAKLRLADLMKWPHIGMKSGDRPADPVTSAMREHGLERNIVATLPYFSAATELLLPSDALILLPSGAARDLLCDPRLRVFAAPAELGTFRQWLVWHNRSHRDPAIQWLVELIAAQCAARASASDSSFSTEIRHLQAAE